MAATNFTPIQLYFSTTASAVPTAANLAQGELAINITDGKLYYEDNGGSVQVIATKGAGTIGGSTTQIQYNNAGALAGNAAMVFNNSTNVTTLTTLNLTNALGEIYGGTAQSTYTQGDVLYASAANTLAKLGIGASTFILTSNGTVPQWVAPSSISVLTATNLAGGVAGSVPYQSGVATTTFLGIGAANRVMTSTGTAPQWVTSLTSLTGVSSSSITNTSLTSGRVVVSSTAGLQADDADLTFDGTTLSAGGLSTVGLSTLVKTVKIGDSGFSGVAVFAATTPAKLYMGTGTVTDVTSAISATNTTGAIASLDITPIAATNTGVTYTNASTLYIAGAPSAGTNITITNPYALYVAGGAAYLGGTLGVTGLFTASATGINSVVGALKVASSGGDGITFGYLNSGDAYDYGVNYSNVNGTETNNSAARASFRMRTVDAAPNASVSFDFRVGSAGTGVFTSGMTVTQAAVTIPGTLTAGATGVTTLTASGAVEVGPVVNAMTLSRNADDYAMLRLKQTSTVIGQIGIGAAGEVVYDAIGGSTTKQHVFQVASSNKLIIDASGLAVTGTGTFNVSATNPVVINRSSTDPSYGVISFNNVVTTAGMLGVLAGGDSNLYLNAPTGGKVLQRINSVAITDVSSTGLVVTGAVSATGNGVLLAKNNTSDGVYVVGGNMNYNAFSISDYGIGSVGALKFASNNAINMTLDASGNLGLGVTPSAWQANNRALQIFEGWASISGNNSQGCCDVSANCFNAGSAAITGWKYTNSSALATLYQQSGGAHKWLTAPSGTAGDTIVFTQAMTLGSDSNLDVTGSVSSGAILRANGSTNPAPGSLTTNVFGTTNAAGGYRLGVGLNSSFDGTNWRTGTDGGSNGGGAILSGYGGGDLQFHTIASTGGTSQTISNAAMTPKMTLTNAGDLLVGATATVNAAKSYFAFTSANNGVYIADTTGVSNAQFMRFDTAASVVCGQITRVGTTSAVVYTATSDYRLKTVTGAVTGQGARIDALKPIDYQWKENNSQARGFLAHEFQTVYPNSVSGEKDAEDEDGKPVYQAMQASTSEVIADLVAELQSLRSRVALLEAK